MNPIYRLVAIILMIGIFTPLIHFHSHDEVGVSEQINCNMCIQHTEKLLVATVQLTMGHLPLFKNTEGIHIIGNFDQIDTHVDYRGPPLNVLKYKI